MSIPKTTPIHCTHERIVKTKKETLKIVESLLEDVSKKELIKACKRLSQSDYCDVVDERNISNICGYPLCSKAIKALQKTYHIDGMRHKVYDITERKKFCSNECYTASNFLKAQISDVPVWLQEEKAMIKLLSDEANCGEFGEEVTIKPNLNVERHAENKQLNKENIGNDNQQFELSAQDVFEEFFIDKSIPSNVINASKLYRSEDSDDYSSENEAGPDSVTNPDIEEAQTDSVLQEVYTEKYMPIRAQPVKSPILIDPLPLKKTLIKRQVVDLDFAFRVLKEWTTFNSLAYIFGDKWVEQTKLKLQNSQSNASSIERAEYEKLCSNLENMFNVDDKADKELLCEPCPIKREGNGELKTAVEVTLEEKVASYYKGDDFKVPQSTENMKKQIPKRKGGTKQLKGKSRAAVREENPNVKISDISEVAPEKQNSPFIPLVDAYTKNTRQQQVVLERLRVTYSNLLPRIGLSYREISLEVRELVSLFKFSSTNVIFKPAEWKLIALVLFRMLRTKFSFCDENQFCNLMQLSQICGDIPIDQIDRMISALTDVL